MKNRTIYLRTLGLYILMCLIVCISSPNQVLGIGTKSKQKQAKTIYPGLVSSTLASHNLIKEDGHVVKPLLEFLTLFGIKHQGTLKSIHLAMQEHFIRKPGLERWDLVDTTADTKVRTSALKLLKNMDMVDAIPHFKVNADYFILFGSTVPIVEMRFNDFLKQYNAGTLQCKNIVFLGGTRRLQPSEIERMKVISSVIFASFIKELNKQEAELTEADMLHFMWKVKAPSGLKYNFQERKNLYFVKSTNITTANQRPGATDTIRTWLREYIPTPGSCHANVEKPYAIRIEKALRHELEKYSRELITIKKHFSITWNSPASESDLLLSVYKDELARAFTEEYNLKKYLGIIKE